MDDRRLEIFLATVKAGSFNKAAQLTNCSQSAVTQIMNSLETELRCQLLDRSHSGVKLTPDGEKLLPFLLDASSSITRLLNQAKLVAEGKTIPIRIGTFSSIANAYLPKIIKSYQAEHRNAVFDVHIGTDILPNWIMNNEIDIALGDDERLKGFPFYPLMEDPYYAVMPKTFAANDSPVISQQDFIDYPFLMAPMNDLHHHLLAVPKNCINVSCDDDSTLLAMVSQELGVTMLPKLSLRNIPDNIQVKELDPPTHRTVGIGTPHKPTSTVLSFTDYIVNSGIFLNK